MLIEMIEYFQCSSNRATIIIYAVHLKRVIILRGLYHIFLIFMDNSFCLSQMTLKNLLFFSFSSIDFLRVTLIKMNRS